MVLSVAETKCSLPGLYSQQLCGHPSAWEIKDQGEGCGSNKVLLLQIVPTAGMSERWPHTVLRDSGAGGQWEAGEVCCCEGKGKWNTHIPNLSQRPQERHNFPKQQKFKKRGLCHGDSQRTRGPFPLWHRLPSANAQSLALETPCHLNHKPGAKMSLCIGSTSQVQCN